MVFEKTKSLGGKENHISSANKKTETTKNVLWNLGLMVSKWVISPTYKWSIPWGEITHFLTIF